jgi:DNA-binding IclR family transcriptional regulator
MLNETAGSQLIASEHTPHPAARPPARVNRSILRSATRPLEVIELFAARRQPLSVSEIAAGLDIPQSSSSVLLQAMSEAGFVARDRQTRRYLPGIRSALLSDCADGGSHGYGGLLHALDALSIGAQADVRLAVRSAVHAHYVHVSWPTREAGLRHFGPGVKMPIGRDALGRMLLLAESEKDVRGILRHANAVSGPAHAVDVEELVDDLRTHRAEGFAVCRDLATQNGAVLAIQLPARFGTPAAIGLGLAAARLPAELGKLVALLRGFAVDIWACKTEMPRGAPHLL